ncbi:MAG TPA: ATP synthase F1 subunit delta [Armatimonadota bacterium]|jgi:F-type H+-transporting ATPase subunit delta
MLPRRIAGRYAEALYGLAAQQGKTAEWSQELAALADVMDANPELRAVLTHPEIPRDQKERIVTQVVQGSAGQQVLAVLFMLIKRGHDPDMRLLHDIYTELWNVARRVMPVTVTSAVPLTESQASALTQALTNRTGASIQLSQAVDANLLAGMVLMMGDRVIDASARTTLEQLRTLMTGV